MKTKTLITNLDGYIYLHRESTEQRGFEFTERGAQLLKEHFDETAIDGRIEILDRNLGGGCGSQNPNTWTDWSVEEMAKMLKKQNIPFEIGQCEVMPIYI